MTVHHILTVGLVLSAIGCGGAKGTADRTNSSATIEASGAILKKVSSRWDGVPDAVLNLTRCIVVVPQAKTTVREGVVDCREAHDRWLPPRSVSLTLRGGAAAPIGDVLIFVVGEAATRSLTAGRLPLNSANAGPGPMLHETLTVTDADLRHEVLLYQQTVNKLEAVRFAGEIRLDTAARQETAFTEAVTAFFNTITPIGIIVHHSATLGEQHSLPNNMGDVDRFHSEKGFEIVCDGKRYHVAYHFLILPDGKVQTGRPERCEGAHSPGYNSYLGISIVGDFSSKDNPRGKKGLVRPTPRQMASLVTLSRQLMSHYGIPLNRVLRHSDVARTECPGDRFPFRAFLRELQ
jgi:N-acetylmuramoyl-L-alanine amidase